MLDVQIYTKVFQKIFRYNEEKNSTDRGYPKSMSNWRFLPNDIEAATEHPDIKSKNEIR